MSTIFWNALKISPALLGASLLVASSTLAAQNVPDQTVATESKAAPLAQQPQTNVVASSNTADQAATLKPVVETLATETPVSPLTSEVVSPSVKPVQNLAQQVPDAGSTNTESAPVLEQINRYSNDANSNTIDQVTNVSQLRDVSPGDWAYEALRSLVERYGCIAGYPDGTFRGNRATSRYEFAAGLNACLNQVERLITRATADFVRKQDLETLQRLVNEFRTELTTLGARVDKLEGRTAFLEARQFSTTTKLNAEVIFAVSDLFGNRDRNVSASNPNGTKYGAQETVFQDRVRLNFDTSFTGKDRLRTRLQAGNVLEFGPLRTGTGAGGNITREGRFGYSYNNDNNVALEKLWYRTPINDFVTAHLFANAGNYDDFVPLLNGNLDSSGTGAISRFGRYNPIYRVGAQNAGLGLTIGAKSPIRVDLGYLAGQNSAGAGGTGITSGAADPGPDAGLFNGSFSALGQVTFQPAKQFAVAATYLHSYNTSIGDPSNGIGSGLGHGTGSIASQVGNTFRPVVGNSYGLEASFSFTPQLVLSGWAGYSQAIVLEAGRADVWNYGATLAINDIGTKGSTLGFVFGMEPKLTGTSNARVANLIYGNNINGGGLPALDTGRREDRNTGFHIEGFYKFKVNNNIAITPGVIWLTAPGHDSRNDDIVIGTVRTTFTF